MAERSLRRDCTALSSLLEHCSLGSSSKTLAEYIWIGAGCDLHSKTRVLDFKPSHVQQIPQWHYDDSSQGFGQPQRIRLHPCALYPDPLRAEHGSVLVLCEAYHPSYMETQPLTAHTSNTRSPCVCVLDAAAASEPAFRVEQQYTLLDPDSQWPLVHGRDFAAAHLAACVRAGLCVSGMQAEHCPGQWSYYVGPCDGVTMADQLWLSRYLLLRISELSGFEATLDPNPVPGEWDGASAPVRFSTLETRQPGTGMLAISSHMHKLGSAHLQHMMLYGQRNSRRYSGQQKGGSAMLFSVGVEDHGAAIRIPQRTASAGHGYYEDRRPASNMDPYLVVSMLAATTLGLPIPSPGARREFSDETGSSSEAGSRSSGALINELDKRMALQGPGTPDGFSGLLSHCRSVQHSHTCSHS